MDTETIRSTWELFHHMAVIEHTRLGNGVYSLAEVARYTKLRPNRVRSWFLGESASSGRPSLFDADYSRVDSALALSFHDLIDALVAGQLRERGVSLALIRRAYERLQDDFATEHPFCHRELYTHGRRIFVSVANETGEEAFSDAVSRQNEIAEVMKPYLDRIDYSDATKLAARWRIAEGVVIDPAINFGKPVIVDTNISAWVLANGYRANDGDAALVATLYGVSESDVRNAAAFSEAYELPNAA